MKEICNKKDCTGCHACYNICPKKCIKMKTDDYGYLKPYINQELCINCGRCKKVCQSVNKIALNTPIDVYAAINKNAKDYKEATSGGIATIISKHIVSNNGVVYGAAVCDDLNVRHIRAEKIEDIEKLKGSKYVQSEIGDSYAKIEADLKKNKEVLFIGTPCQVAGLYGFFGKKYDKLYTCDIVCHGTPPYKYLKDHLVRLGVEEGTNLSFRNEYGYYLEIMKDDNIIYSKKNYYDIYCLAFLKGLIAYESCFKCGYASRKRIGDITLGDFLGFNDEKKFIVEHKNGLSMVMLNTEKGERIFRNLADNMFYQKRSIEEAVSGNKQLRMPSKKHKNYDKFRDDYKKYGFEKAAKRALWKERIAYAIIDRIGKYKV